MATVDITVGGRTFEVACDVGEESYLLAAAGMLDLEANVLIEQIGRLPEARMLLMAGLMLADKTAVFEGKTKTQDAKIAELEAELAELKGRLVPKPERIEVAVVPSSVTDTLQELAARAESLAQKAEERAAG
jgi:cell division protein ZapA